MSDHEKENLSKMNSLVGKGDKYITTTSGLEVTINKAKVGNTASILNLITNVFQSLGVDNAEGLPQVDLNNPAVLLKLISDNFQLLIPLAEDLTDLTEDEINDLEFDDFYDICVALWEHNKGFFLKTLNRLQGNPTTGADQGTGALGQAAQQTN